MKHLGIAALVVLALAVGAAWVAPATTLPDFGSATFSNPTQIDNAYLPLQALMRYVYMGEKMDEDTGETEVERSDMFVTLLTKDILGVTCRVVRDTAWVNDQLAEETDDWYAQDDDGNVWYMGEYSTAYEYDDEGNLIGTSTAGSWEAGVDGALPGWLMKANPLIGDSYYQEYYAGEAEDQAEVLSLSEAVSIDYGDFTDCLQTLESTALEPDVLEHKYYAAGLGLIFIEEELDEEGNPAFTMELVKAIPEPSVACLAFAGLLAGAGRRFLGGR